MHPRVSVIVPVYNSGPYLGQCLDSILSQTEQDIELICIDDGSTDDSLLLLEDYAARDPRMKLLHTEGLGAGAARNHGLANAHGTYLSFLDSDDFFEPDMLSEVADAMDLADADIAVYGSWVFDTQRNSNRQAKWNLKKELLPSWQPFSSRDISDSIFNAFGNYTWNKLFRANLIRDGQISFQEISRTNDLLFTCRALSIAQRIITVDKSYAHYRVNTSTSLQATNDRDPLAFLDAFLALEEYLVQSKLYEMYKKSFLSHLLDGIVANADSIRNRDTLALLRSTLIKATEPHFRLLEQPDGTFDDQRQLDHYRCLVTMDMEDYLFRRCKDYAKERDDLYWYIDWDEWRIWEAGKRIHELEAEVERMSQELQASPVSRMLHALKSSFD